MKYQKMNAVLKMGWVDGKIEGSSKKGWSAVINGEKLGLGGWRSIRMLKDHLQRAFQAEVYCRNFHLNPRWCLHNAAWSHRGAALEQISRCF